MLESSYLYLWLNLLIMVVSVAGSKLFKVNIKPNAKALWQAIALVSAFFIIWDIIFTHNGIWGFNPKYNIAIAFIGLPLGELLFFFTIPFAFIYLYSALNLYSKKDILASQTGNISNFLIGFSITLACVYYTNWITLTTFLLLGGTVAFLHFRAKPIWLSRFYLAFAVFLFPYLLVSAILTGTAISEEVIWYNQSEIIGTHIGSIPFENIFYAMLLVLVTTLFYERFSSTSGNVANHKRQTE